ncbi:MAG: hypothetical protein IKP40_10590 [Clostridia bacterium]|nr:hypothetical protein [Clostridia bacterium]
MEARAETPSAPAQAAIVFPAALPSQAKTAAASMPPGLHFARLQPFKYQKSGNETAKFCKNFGKNGKFLSKFAMKN